MVIRAIGANFSPLTVFFLAELAGLVVRSNRFEIRLNKAEHQVSSVILAGKDCGLRLKCLENCRIPAGSLPSRVSRDRVPIGFDEGDNLFILAKEVPRAPILHSFSLQIGDSCDAHLRQSRLRPLVNFDACRRAKLACKQIVHREAQELPHLVPNAGLMEELVAVRTGHFDNVKVPLFSAGSEFL